MALTFKSVDIRTSDFWNIYCLPVAKTSLSYAAKQAQHAERSVWHLGSWQEQTPMGLLTFQQQEVKGNRSRSEVLEVACAEIILHLNPEEIGLDWRRTG